MHDDTRTLARFLVRELARADRQAAETGAVVGLYEFHRGEAAAYRMALAHIAGTNGHRTVDTFIAQVKRELTPAGECPHHIETDPADMVPGWRCPYGCGAFVLAMPPAPEPLGGWEPRS